MKTLTKSTRKGLVAKLEATLTGDVVDHALAFCCKWEQPPKKPGAFVAPVWARTRTATIRGLEPVLLKEGLDFFVTSRWRDNLTHDEARACLAIGRKLRKHFFPELAGSE